jgi:biotin synthase
MEEEKPVEICEMIRMGGTTKLMPETQVRLSAGRMNMSRRRSGHVLFAGAIRFFCRRNY